MTDDTISRQAAIDALKNDMASLDHIIKGMSANDVRLDAYVSQRNQVNYDIYTINNLPPALGTNLAEVGTDCISRQAAIDLIESIETERLKGNIELIYAPAIKGLRALPPAQPDVPDINVGDTISRKKAFEALNRECRCGAVIDHCGLETAMDIINELPPAQPEPKRGKWIKISPANIYECSECGKNVMTNDICAYDFCHGCGADMRGEQDE